ncbi:uncharacterized protein LOC143357524 [Halictus rubicundus]|uniref:uncharacterized protein LOC143357524 n=1 Tax=Halictus rubicundus TaxID=77578 RepID=UPI00403562FB
MELKSTAPYPPPPPPLPPPYRETMLQHEPQPSSYSYPYPATQWTPNRPVVPPPTEINVGDVHMMPANPEPPAVIVVHKYRKSKQCCLSSVISLLISIVIVVVLVKVILRIW